MRAIGHSALRYKTRRICSKNIQHTVNIFFAICNFLQIFSNAKYELFLIQDFINTSLSSVILMYVYISRNIIIIFIFVSTMNLFRRAECPLLRCYVMLFSLHDKPYMINDLCNFMQDTIPRHSLFLHIQDR